MYLDINRKATEQRRKMFVDDATLSQLYEYTARHGLSNIDKIPSLYASLPAPAYAHIRPCADRDRFFSYIQFQLNYTLKNACGTLPRATDIFIEVAPHDHKLSAEVFEPRNR